MKLPRTREWFAGPTTGGFTIHPPALTATTSYTVTLTDGNNCSTTSTPATTITVSAGASVSISNVSANLICNGQSTTLTATASRWWCTDLCLDGPVDNSTVGTNSPTLTVFLTAPGLIVLPYLMSAAVQPRRIN